MSRTLRGHVALFLRGPWNRSLIPMPWGWVGEGWSAPRCLESGSPFFQGHVPLPRAVTADSSSPASDAPLYAPTSSGPPPWDEARAGAGEGEGRTHRSRGCCSPARAPARPPRCQPGSSPPRSQLLGSSPRLPPSSPTQATQKSKLLYPRCAPPWLLAAQFHPVLGHLRDLEG